MLRNKSVKNEIDNDDKKTAYKEVLNKMIDKVNELKLLESSYASYFNKVNEILIELSDEIYEDSLIKIKKLIKRLILINIQKLIDMQMNTQILLMVKQIYLLILAQYLVKHLQKFRTKHILLMI